MKKKGLMWMVVVLLALVAGAYFIDPERRATVTSLFAGGDSFEGRSKDQWLAELRSSDEKVVRRAHSKLVYTGGGENATPILIVALNDNSEKVRSEAADILGALGREGKAAVPGLITALKDKSELVQTKAADALGKMAPDSSMAIPALIEVLKEPKPEIQRHVAGCLGSFGPAAKSAWAELDRVRKEADPDLRPTISKAMFRIDEEAAGKIGLKAEPKMGLIKAKIGG
jgi:HEAT repeat protein